MILSADLVAAVVAEDLPRAEAALRADADPNERDPLGYPPLCLAAVRGQPQMVELLLTAGADPLQVTSGWVPRHCTRPRRAGWWTPRGCCWIMARSSTSRLRSTGTPR